MALTDEQIYDALKDLPDFDRLPLPKSFYEKFNIPPPKLLTPMEAIRLAEKTAFAPGPLTKVEIRDPAPGGVRPLIEVEPVPVEVKHGVSIEDAFEAPQPEESQRQDSQVHCDLSGCRQDVSSEVRS